MSNSTWCYFNPVRVVYAPIECIPRYVTETHILLVTTSGFTKRGVVQRIRDILSPIQVTVWDGVNPNPDIKDLDAVASRFCKCKLGGVIGLGGGSALDAAKVLATLLSSSTTPTLTQVFRDGSLKKWHTRLPLVVIPTTSGTGSEVTPFATVWDHDRQMKYSMLGDFVYPDVALLDATLLVTLGANDTLYPALDATSHALESLWNKNSTPLSRAYAYEALGRINESLPRVLSKPDCLKSRQQLQIASTLAGLAISQTKTAIAHAISYSLTSAYGVPHGLACSILLDFFIEEFKNTTLKESEHECIEKTQKMLRGLKLVNRLKTYCYIEAAIDEVVVNEERMSNSIIKFERAKIKKWLKESVDAA